jgi:hypothetical protein
MRGEAEAEEERIEGFQISDLRINEWDTSPLL